MSTPTFSIITITRNHVKGLQNTHQSILDQSCADYEWIVIDGASNDTTTEFLRATNANWLSEDDNGIYDAMNKGIKRANGHYIIFMNAGDVFNDKDVLEKILPKTLNKTPLIYGDSFEGGHYKSARPAAKLKLGLFTHHQAIFYARDELQNLRYDTKYKIAADYDFTARFLMNNNFKAEHIALPICIFEEGGISQQHMTLARHEQFRIRKNLKICTAIENAAIYLYQSATALLRKHLPDLYWHLKSSGNRRGVTSQNPPPQSHPENQT